MGRGKEGCGEREYERDAMPAIWISACASRDWVVGLNEGGEGVMEVEVEVEVEEVVEGEKRCRTVGRAKLAEVTRGSRHAPPRMRMSHVP